MQDHDHAGERGYDDIATDTLLQALHLLGLATEQAGSAEAGSSETLRAAIGAQLIGVGQRLVADHGTGDSPVRHVLQTQRDPAVGVAEIETWLPGTMQRLGTDRSLLGTVSRACVLPERAPLRLVLQAAAMTTGATQNLVLAAGEEIRGVGEQREVSVSAAAEDLHTVIEELGEAGML